MTGLQAQLDRALQLHQSGQVAQAIALYETVLRQQQDNAQLLYLLGTASLQAGRREAGMAFLQRCLALDPGHAFAHNNLATVLNDLQQPAAALASCDRALQLKPGYADAHNNRGNAFTGLQRLPEALDCYDRALAIRPDYVHALVNRGNALKSLGRVEEALASYDRALVFQPGLTEAHVSRGNALLALGRKEEALACHEQALRLQPDHLEALNCRGVALHALGRYTDALASYERALALAPDHPDVHCNRGMALESLERLEEALASHDRALAGYDRSSAGVSGQASAYNNRGIVLGKLRRNEEALASFDRALAIAPDDVDAHNNRGGVLVNLGRMDEALASYDRALALRPGFVQAYNNRGIALKMLGRLEEALACYEQAGTIDPGYVDTWWQKSLLLLLMGRYSEGWALYEWRLRKPDLQNNFYDFPEPAWRGGRDIAGKTLFVHGEQGYGDVIQFCRYVPLLADFGARIIFEVRPALVDLVATLDCRMTVTAKGSPPPGFDAYCPLMSLPHVLHTTLETIPARVPYLRADRRKVQAWQHKLGPRTRPRIGLAWSGAAYFRNDHNRTIRLDALAGLVALPAEWHALQKEYRPHDTALLGQHPQIRQHQDELGDFSDTAALIECMDLVISVDTSIAHLAGALGKPVWILLPQSPDYRWLLGRDDSPWYPTARLFRQPAFGDWAGVVAAVAAALRGQHGW